MRHICSLCWVLWFSLSKHTCLYGTYIYYIHRTMSTSGYTVQTLITFGMCEAHTGMHFSGCSPRMEGALRRRIDTRMRVSLWSRDLLATLYMTKTRCQESDIYSQRHSSKQCKQYSHVDIYTSEIPNMRPIAQVIQNNCSHLEHLASASTDHPPIPHPT